MRNYIFLVGSGRCGTTALADLLGKHSSISHTPELKFFSYAMAERKVYEPLTFDSTKSFFIEKALGKLLKFRVDLEYKRHDAVQMFDKAVKPDNVKGLSKNEMYKIVFDLLVDSFQDKVSDYVVLQTPNNLYYLNITKEILGDIKVIGMIRDPKNFLVSAMRGDRKWYQKDITAIVQWNIASEYLEEFSKSPDYDFLLIKQEDLLLKPNDVINNISDFLSLDLSSLYEEKKMTINSAFSAGATDEEILTRYKKHLNEKDIQRIEYLSQKYMKNNSYGDFSSDFSKIGLFEKIAWKVLYWFTSLKLKMQIFMRLKGRVDFYFKIRDKIEGYDGERL
jgi:sulfotransferase family protein